MSCTTWHPLLLSSFYFLKTVVNEGFIHAIVYDFLIIKMSRVSHIKGCENVRGQAMNVELIVTTSHGRRP